MGKAALILTNAETRDKACSWVQKAPAGTRLTFDGPKRSLEQNALMWAMLTEVAEQVTWHGLKLTASDWKAVFSAALRLELRMVPNLDGDGLVQLGGRTSEMSKDEMSSLIELMHARADQLGVTFSDH